MFTAMLVQFTPSHPIRVHSYVSTVYTFSPYSRLFGVLTFKHIF